MTPEPTDEGPCRSNATPAELWRRAQEYRAMSESVADSGQREEFRRLAWRYEKMAMEKRG